MSNMEGTALEILTKLREMENDPRAARAFDILAPVFSRNYGIEPDEVVHRPPTTTTTNDDPNNDILYYMPSSLMPRPGHVYHDPADAEGVSPSEDLTLPGSDIEVLESSNEDDTLGGNSEDTPAQVPQRAAAAVLAVPVPSSPSTSIRPQAREDLEGRLREEMQHQNNQQNPATSTSRRNNTENNMPEECPQCDNSSTSASRPPPNENVVDDMISRLTCVVCYEDEKAILLEPCMHLCVCARCAERLGRCPLCTAPITRKKRVFY